jgi:group I intron endonuclease
MTQEKTTRRGVAPIEPHEEKLGCIYRVTCIVTSKSYIGQAKLVKYKNGKPYRYGATGRWSDHVSSARQTARAYPIFEAIRTHGEKNFTHEILEVVPLENLDTKETHYIEQYNTLVPFGYNVTEHMPNPHTADRVQLIEEKYGETEVDASVIESTQGMLQLQIEHKYQDSLKSLTGREITKIRIATAKNTSAKRQSGANINYTCVTVYVYTADMKYAKDALKFRFGGVKSSISEAHNDAMEFVRLIPVTAGKTEILDQVQTKSLTIEINR